MATSGKNTYVAIGTAASETDISSYCDSASVDRAVKDLEATTFGATQETSTPGLKKVGLKFSGNADTSLYTTMSALVGVSGKSLIIGLEGSTTGKRKVSVTGFLMSYNEKSTVAGKITFDAEFAPEAAATFGTF